MSSTVIPAEAGIPSLPDGSQAGVVQRMQDGNPGTSRLNKTDPPRLASRTIHYNFVARRGWLEFIQRLPDGRQESRAGMTSKEKIV